jgi:branched-chain amino acid transport system ATP-binding protein
MLELSGLTAGYAGSTVLHGLDLTVAAGTVHAVVGHNGAGKTTLVHTVAGMLRPMSGTVRLDGTDVAGKPTHVLARAGLGLVPQGRRVFRGVTVAEHLRLAHRPLRGRDPGGKAAEWTPARILELFPRLAERRRHRGADLSGGEQQMLALARALLGNPRVLLLDEPTEGLSPALARQVRELVTASAGAGTAVLLVSPSPAPAASCATTLTVLTSGRVTARITGEAARSDPDTLHRALELTPSRRASP